MSGIEQLYPAESMFQSSFHAAPVAMLMVDGTGTIVMANPQSQSLFGYSSDEMINQSVEMLIPYRYRESHVHRRNAYLASPVSKKMGARSDIFALHKNGDEIPVDLGLNTVETDNGTFVVAVIADISNYKNAEKKLQLLNESLQETQSICRSLIDQSVNFVGVLTLDGKILDANRTALQAAGIDFESIKGMPFWETAWWTHSVELQEKLKNAIKEAASGNSVEFEATHPVHDGKHVHITFSLKPVFDESGNVLYLIPEGRDITQHKLREAELNELLTKLDSSNAQLETTNQVLKETSEKALAASRTKSEFLANMSHEIRTPMTAIIGYTDILIGNNEREYASPENLEALKIIKRNGTHLLSLINDILDLSKIEAGQIDIETVETSPTAVVQEVFSLMNVRAAEKGLKFCVVWNGKIPSKINTDPLRLKQCLINLVGNAIKFTQQGSIQIVAYLDTAFPGESKFVFDIIDTGIGMTESQVSKLFTAFSQADTSMTRRFGGTGLGLFISRRLAELMGGNVSCRSTAGVGSTFSLSVATGRLDGVPLINPNDELDKPNHVVDEENHNEHQVESNNLTGCRVLFAEDGIDNQRLISFVLKKAGAVVTVVDNGRLAVERLTQDGSINSDLVDPSPYDIILMDMQMPEMDGYSAAALLKQKGSQVPIIALTAHAMTGEREKCLRAGCDDYATKPIDRPKLISTIQNCWKAIGYADA